VYDRILNIVTF